MLNINKKRQEIYDKIKETSRDEYILHEMIRLGFWPKEGNMPEDPADVIRRKGQLNKELCDLQQQLRKLKNFEYLKNEAKKKRLKESREKQRQTKHRKEQTRKERAEAWQQRKKRELLFLGDDVSGGLNNNHSKPQLLGSNQLPIFETIEELATKMGVTVNELRFLAFNRKVTKTSHYINFGIPKKSGGIRQISAPKPRLKQLQHWIYTNILDKVDLSKSAHGFRKGFSIVSNAAPHVNAKVVINIDLKDFFPTITYRRIKGMFQKLGYSEAIATVLALLSSQAQLQQVDNVGETLFIAIGERHLPQGAPSSPTITNIICRRLDKRLKTIADKTGFMYTRYADDITFSSNQIDNKAIGRILRQANYLIKKEGFFVNKKKTKILRSGRRQEVTGIVVNKKMSVNRKTLKAFRAVLYQIEKDGPEGKSWGNSTDVIRAIHGYANFVYMVDQDKGTKFKEQVQRIIDKYSYSPPKYVKPETEAQKQKRLTPKKEKITSQESLWTRIKKAFYILFGR